HATADTSAPPIYHVKDLYVGFNLWDLLRGRYDIRSLHADGGHLDLVLHPDGTLNLMRAKNLLDSAVADTGAMHLDLRDVQLRNFTASHLEEATGQRVTARIVELALELQMAGDIITAEVDGDLRLDVI